MPLTATAIDKAKAASKTQRLWDSKGLYLEISPAGGKWWRLKYRIAHKEKRVSLGVYPDTSLKRAREKRDEARRLLADGLDPSTERQAERQLQRSLEVNSFEAVAREWYGRYSKRWTERHARDVWRRLENNLFRDLGALPIASIGAPALLASLRKVETRAAYDLAHRMLGVAGQVFRYGVATGRCDRDPSGDLRGALTPHKSKNQPAIGADELPKLLRAIEQYTDLGGERQTVLALKLLCLTFVRTAELVGAEWSELSLADEAAPTWTIPGGRMKGKVEHLVPLSRQAAAVFRELNRAANGSRYVFPGRNPDKPISNNTLLFALYRMGYKGRMTGHGFRAVASSMLNEAGLRSDVIERQLAHKEPNKVRAAYNRTEYLIERRHMMQRWADMVDMEKTRVPVTLTGAAVPSGELRARAIERPVPKSLRGPRITSA